MTRDYYENQLYSLGDSVVLAEINHGSCLKLLERRVRVRSGNVGVSHVGSVCFHEIHMRAHM